MDDIEKQQKGGHRWERSSAPLINNQEHQFLCNSQLWWTVTLPHTASNVSIQVLLLKAI